VGKRDGMILRYYQEEAVVALFDYFTRKRGNPVVAMPTGTGKSLTIAEFIRRANWYYPGTRFLMLTHVQELIEQNAKTMLRLAPDCPLGINSAGLNQRDTALPVIFGGVKSVANMIEQIGWRDILIIDEGHLVSPKAGTTYQKVIAELKRINPKLKVIMFTATPYRLGQGLLTDEGGIATDIAYDITGVEAFNKLIVEGYISPLIPFRKEDIGLDLSQVAVSNGEYNQHSLQHAIDREEITFKALTQMCEMAHNRQSWLIFASGVAHAENIANMLSRFGVSAAAVHSDMGKGDRNARIEAFKKRQLRAIVNMNVLTTGFDHPPIDFIGMLRPTLSPGLWVQMLGRGTRPSPETGKVNCLVADFAGNTRKLGPINDPKIPKKKGKGAGTPPIKDCEVCGCSNHISAIVCINCGSEFTFEEKIIAEASTLELIDDGPVIEYFNVNSVHYQKWTTRSKGEDVLKCTYHVTGSTGETHFFSEFLWFGQHKMAGKTRDFWRKRHWEEAPETLQEAIEKHSELRPPSRIRVWTNKKPYPEILNAEFSTWQQ
jgi:DNA repair protein RadD